MAVTIRLARVGRTGMPFYRIVAIDSRKARDGQALEILGTYDALKGSLVTYNAEGVEAWVAKGAMMTDSVKKIDKLHRKAASTAPAVASK
jgi:small subunit ribosomal protein S16